MGFAGRIAQLMFAVMQSAVTRRSSGQVQLPLIVVALYARQTSEPRSMTKGVARHQGPRPNSNFGEVSVFKLAPRGGLVMCTKSSLMLLCLTLSIVALLPRRFLLTGFGGGQNV
jgi:hypothetical protein